MFFLALHRLYRERWNLICDQDAEIYAIQTHFNFKQNLSLTKKD